MKIANIRDYQEYYISYNMADMENFFVKLKNASIDIFENYLPKEEWLHLKDAAEYYGVSKSTILRRAKAGMIPTDKNITKYTCYSTKFIFPISKNKSSKIKIKGN